MFVHVWEKKYFYLECYYKLFISNRTNSYPVLYDSTSGLFIEFVFIGTEAQVRQLAKLLANQMTARGIGVGAEKLELSHSISETQVPSNIRIYMCVD